MQFRTEISFDSPTFFINHSDKILALGSCFAENISAKLIENKFDVLCNPFGVLYNPVSILNSLKYAVERNQLSDEDLIFNQSEWHSFLHHSEFSSTDKQELISKANESITVCGDFLAGADLIILTFGTSNVYRYKKIGNIVSNCHKVLQSEFNREMLSVEEISKNVGKIIELIHSVNPKTKLIFSVSPIRHTKDGFVENSLSKASLLLGIQQGIENAESCFYFPSYEIMMDDLRDYRFYSEDMLHPNQSAINYIWEIFKSKLLSEDCKKVLQEILPVIQASKHRVRNYNSEESRKFSQLMLNKTAQLKAKYSYIDFENEQKIFSDKK